MKKYLFLITIILMSYMAKSQDCFKYFPTKKGTSLEYTNYDKKGKITSVIKRTVIDKKTEKGETTIDYKMETTPADYDTTMIRNFSIICKDGKLYVNLASMFDASSMTDNSKGMDVEIEGSNVEMPGNPKVGQELEGGEIKMNFKNEGETVMSFTTVISNRKVESIEDITTPAGTFNSFKITYDIEVTMGFLKVKSKAAEWYTKKYGMIKSENYNKRGKLSSYSLLTKIID